MKQTTGERFWSKVNIQGPWDCWEWKRHRNEDGYGSFRFRGGMRLAHRVAWILSVGEIPDDLGVLHHCDNPACCNPAHIFLGTQLDNMRDAKRKGRLARGDTHSSRTKPESVARGDRNGMRRYPERSSFAGKRYWGDDNVMRRRPEVRCRGERNGSCKLTEDTVRAIRRDYVPGKVRYADLAEKYGIAFGHVGQIIRGERWAHIK